MAQPQLREDQWERLYAILRACPGIYVGQEAATRLGQSHEGAQAVWRRRVSR